MAREILYRTDSSRTVRTGERPAADLRFDGLVAALSAWLIAGLYLDGWAHQHVPNLETFFTPWHAVLYSGFMVVAAAIAIRALLNYLDGHPLTRALPVGYDLSFLGIILFVVGAVGDLAWHSLFGIEVSIQALLSPTHLLLAFGGMLTITGPLRSAWHATDLLRQPRDHMPMLLCALYSVAIFAFFTQYANPFGETFAAALNARGSSAFSNQAVGILGILVATAILMGFILLLVRRFRIPFGGITLIVGGSTVLMVLMRNNSSFGQTIATGPVPIILAGLLAGLAGDLLLAWLKPSADRVGAFRAFAFALPLALYSLYFAAIALFGGGLGWSIHLWTGTIVQAGIVGWLLSYMFFPPLITAPG